VSSELAEGEAMREVTIGSSRLQLYLGDITKLDCHVGAIVHAANESLRPGGGISDAIYLAAGSELAIETRWIGRTGVGRAVATSAGRLNADAVIHAVGPVWQGGALDEDRLLAAAYRSSLELADEKRLTSIAFSSISTEIYGYPVERASTVAIGTIAAYLRRGSAIEEVIMVLYTAQDYGIFDKTLTRWERTQAERAQAERSQS